MSAVLNISVSELNWAKEQLAGDEYEVQERSYKVAVHKVMAAFFSSKVLASAEFPTRLADVFQANNPDYSALGLAPAEIQAVERGLSASRVSFKNGIANLAGGQWGAAQFNWIPRAVEFDLGEDLRATFAGLVAEGRPVAERVDGFRESLYAVQVALKDRGGFLAHWTLFPVAMNFVGMLLGAYDTDQYIFYAAKRLRAAMTDWGVEWPKGSAGQKYQAICAFAAAARETFQRAGVPVRDILDVQGIIWVRGEVAVVPSEEGGESKPEAVPPVVRGRLDLEAVARELATAAYWQPERALALVKKADRWHQLLFQGPPGTGKTFVAKKLAELMAGDEEGRVESVQFHPSYGYEDFIEGIRPKVTADNKSLLYEVKAGVFMRLVARAKEYQQERFFLIIDEMNRANLARVFGELLFGLEYRGENNEFTLPYSGESRWIPENITIIGAMNTADRSIALVDAAIRRRFRHVDFPPDIEVLRGWLKDNDLGQLADDAPARLDRLNAELLKSLDGDRLIGHTYLMRDDLAEVGYEAVWEEDIEPVLNEHLYNRREEVLRLRALFLAA